MRIDEEHYTGNTKQTRTTARAKARLGAASLVVRRMLSDLEKHVGCTLIRWVLAGVLPPSGLIQLRLSNMPTSF